MSRRHEKLNSHIWTRVRSRVKDRDGWRCVACGRPGHLEVDHIEPMSFNKKRDPFDLDNLQTLCRSCHINKTGIENSRPNPARDAWKDFMDERLESITEPPETT